MSFRPAALLLQPNFFDAKSWSNFKCRKKVRSMKGEKMKRNGRKKVELGLLSKIITAYCCSKKVLVKFLYIFQCNDENHLRKTGNIFSQLLQNCRIFSFPESVAATFDLIVFSYLGL